MSTGEEKPFNLPAEEAKRKLDADTSAGNDTSKEPKDEPSSKVALLEQQYQELPLWTRKILLWTFVIVFFAALVNYGTAHIRQVMCQWGHDKQCEHRPKDWDRALFP